MPGKSGAIRAGGAFVELFSDDSKLARGLKSAGAKVKSWGKEVTAIGTKVFAAGAVVKGALSGAAAAFAEIGAELAHMSERTGIGVSTLSQLKYAADQSGVAFEDFETAIKKQQKTIGQASIGNKQAIASLAAIGLKVQDLINLTPEEQFEAIAAAIAAIPNPAQRAAAAMGIFGKNGTAILPMLLKGADGIAALKAEADRLGLTMSKDDAQSALGLSNAMKTVWATLKGVTVAIGSALAPTLTDLAKRAAEVIGNVIHWIKENRGLVVAVSTAATAAMAIGAVLVGVGYAISFLAPAFAGLSMAISAAGATFGVVLSVFGAILSPIGLIVAALVGIGTYFLATSGIVGQVVDYLKGVFAGLAEDFGVAFDAIKNALSAGDFTAAARVLWAFLKVEWIRGIDALNGVWNEAKVYFLDLWTNAVADLAETLATAWDGIAAGFYDAVATMTEAWGTFAKFLLDVLSPVASTIASKFAFISAKIQGMDDDAAQLAADMTGAVAGAVLSAGGKGLVDQVIADAKAKRDKALADYNAGDTTADIEEGRQRDLKANRAGLLSGRSAAATKADADLADAHNALAQATAAANAAKKRVPQAVSDAGAAADDAIEVAAKGGKAVGTFSGFALGGLGGASGLDKVADNTGATNDHLRNANNRLQRIEENTRNLAVFT